MKNLSTFANPTGRVLISLMFLLSGLGKISAYAGTQAYMTSAGVPGQLLPLVIITEVVGALAIIVGYKTEIVAFLLAGFTLLSAFFFHHDFSNQMQMIMFLKNVAISGGFLFLVANGAGAYSLDSYFSNKA